MKYVYFVDVEVWKKHFGFELERRGTHETFFLSVSLFSLKLLTNEKRGWLIVVLFVRSPFKLFSLKFSNKSVQAPSCERHKTTQGTLFLLFANNNCSQ